MIHPGAYDPGERRPDIRSLVASARSEVECSGSGLDPESPVYRAAVLLLVVQESGFNVDRLSRATGFSREFVARCLRHLVDNGWWVDGTSTCDWRRERATSEHFWWDVDVALGRRLRRVSAAGEPQWAEPSGWVKEFEYAARTSDTNLVYNAYRHIPPHNPSAVYLSPGDEQGDEVSAEAEAAAPPSSEQTTDDLQPETSQPPEPPVVPRWLGEPDGEDHALGSAAVAVPPSLHNAWTEVEWLG